MKHNNIAALAKLGLFSLLMMITTTAVNAQKQFTLEDLNFGGNNYHNMVPKNRYLTWWGDQLVRRNTDECSLVNKQNGKETVMFTIDDINKWAGTDDSTKIRHLFYASFPYPNKSLVLITGKKERMLIDFKLKKVVWRQNCEGENFAEWNAASKAVAFVKNDNLFVTNGEGKTTQLTTDGSREIVYGQSVHRDEFGIYKGTFWSPDGQSLAFYRMDQSMVADYPLVNIDTRIATETPIKYPMAGETSHKVTVGVYNLKTGKTIYLKAGDPTDRYFTNIAWSPDCKKVYMIELNRDQTDMQLVSYDATTGNKLETLYKEHNDKYVHPMTPITFLPWDDSKFILQSEKDGYNHLYLFNTKGEQLKQITSGKWIVLDLVGFNKSKKSAIILSTECSPIQNNLYMVNIETGKRTLLDNGKGFHATTRGAGGHCDIILSGTGKYIYDNYSEPDVPRKINIISTENAKNVNYFTAADPWKGYNVPEYSCGTIKAADGTTDLYYRMVKPVNFDPNKNILL